MQKFPIGLLLEVFLSENKNDPSVVAYFDGSDARLYKALNEKLGSEVKVQNALILLGLMKKLSELNTSESYDGIAKSREIFPEYVGISYDEFGRILDSYSSMT